MQSYSEFLDLSVGFPQEGYNVIDDELYFQDLNLMEMIETYGSPLRFTYLPLNLTQVLFKSSSNNAMQATTKLPSESNL